MNVGIILCCSVVLEAPFRWFDLKIITVQQYYSADEMYCCVRECEGKQKLTLMIENVQIREVKLMVPVCRYERS
jgi:hypothetical protein